MHIGFSGFAAPAVASGLLLASAAGVRALPATNTPDGFAFIPAGAFAMGDAFGEGLSGETPAHSVTVSAFYAEQREVTRAQWNAVYRWATNNGYGFRYGSGKGDDHPVYGVSWYDCAKWCNARSEREGLRPCYYTAPDLAAVYRTGELDLSGACVNWAADGYRLPTEAEWEKAARGGAAGRRFPWGDADTITHDRANYYSWWQGGQPADPYDLNPAEGFHPLAFSEPWPYSLPPGRFAPNGYGLYDVSGNINEWCWDWYSAGYYAGSPGADPRGPPAGTLRACRGGAFNFRARSARVAYREGNEPGLANAYYSLGLRCVRGHLEDQTPGPYLRVNGRSGRVSLAEGEPAVITVYTKAGGYAGLPVDAWVAACGITAASTAWYYLNASGAWEPFDGSPASCRPAYAGPLFELAPVPVFVQPLPRGVYLCWFALDYPMDGQLGLAPGQHLVDQAIIEVR